MPIISYLDGDRSLPAGNFDLKAYHCTSVDCSSGSDFQLESDHSGTYTSITIGSDGFPIISHLVPGVRTLKVYHCASVDCSSGQGVTLDSTGDLGGFMSITIGSDGLPIISYYNTNNGLEVLHCASTTCGDSTPV